MRSWVVATLFVLLSPVALAVQVGIVNDPGPAETTLYVHGQAGLDLVLTVQEPEPGWSTGGSTGLATVTQACVRPAPGQAQGDHHTWYAFVSPGAVQYDGDEVRYHPMRGIARDLRLDADAPVRLVWYLETGAGQDSLPLPAPNVVVRATLREGDRISPDHTAMDAGPVIAQGETSPALLAGPATPDHPQVRYVPATVDGETRHVYEFSLRLPYAAQDVARVPSEAGFNLRVDAFVENPACDGADEKVMPHTVNLHSSDGHRPRFTWSVLDPLRIAYLAPQFIGGDLVVQANVQSPWGTYDVGEPGADGIRLTVEGPTTPVHAERIEWSPPRTHDDPLGLGDGRTLTWVWDLEADRPEDGRYVVRLTAQNLQGSASSTAVATFEVGSGRVVACQDGAAGPRCEEAGLPPTQQSPGAAPVTALALLGALAAWRRRA